MKSKVITQTIKKLYTIKLIPALVFAVFAVIILLHFPFKKMILPDTLSNIQSIFDTYESGEEFLQMTVPVLYYTGYDCQRKGAVKGSYYYTFIDDQIVFFLLRDRTSQHRPEELYNVRLKTKLIQDSVNRSFLIQNFSNDINWTKTALNTVTAGFIVSELDYFTPKAYALLLFLGTALIYTLIYIAAYIYFIIKPEYSYVCRHLSHSGEALRLLEQADFELKNSRCFYVSDMSFTDSFFIELGRYTPQIIPLDSILWAYKHSTMNKFTGITYNLLFYTPYGVTRCTRKQKFEADAVLDYIQEHRPDVRIGYTHENKKAVRKILKASRAALRRNPVM